MPVSRILAALPLMVAVLDPCAAPAQRPPARVAVTPAIEKEVAAGNTFVASVQPLKQAIIGSAVDGRVIELVADEGDRVEALTPLAQLLTHTINLELDAAVAELELRSQALKELQNGSRREELDQAKAQMLGAQADLEFANTQLERLETLRTSNAASEQDLDQAAAAASLAEQNYLELKAAYELAVAGPRTERIAQAQAQVAMQQAIVDQIKDRIKKYTIQSRFDGYVIAKHTEQGAWLKQGDPVMEVVALDQVKIEAYVTEQHVPFIKRGMEVRIEFVALPDRSFTGTIAAVIPQADTRTRTFPVKILVDNEITSDGPVIKSGMSARVELPIGARQKAVMVPKDALVLGGPKPIVYVVGQQPNQSGQTSTTVTPIPVELGVALPNLIQVKGALQPGQSVVVEGNERLMPGQEVIVAE